MLCSQCQPGNALMLECRDRTYCKQNTIQGETSEWDAVQECRPVESIGKVLHDTVQDVVLCIHHSRKQKECTCQCSVRFQFILNDLQEYFQYANCISAGTGIRVNSCKHGNESRLLNIALKGRRRQRGRESSACGGWWALGDGVKRKLNWASFSIRNDWRAYINISKSPEECA